VHSRPTPRADSQATVLADAHLALVEVYGYLLHRCRSVTVAEDLAAESVLAAVDRIRSGSIDTITTAYVVGIARHKLVDHWRKEERERRHLTALAGRKDSPTETDDPASFEPGRALEVLALLRPAHRTVLTLRYVDDLPVGEIAHLLGRSVESTETLLTRAKREFRGRYGSEKGTSRD
jgi:RNA polymerase sigma-70 factor (ECF subfamily)